MEVKSIHYPRDVPTTLNSTFLQHELHVNPLNNNNAGPRAYIDSSSDQPTRNKQLQKREETRR